MYTFDENILISNIRDIKDYPKPGIIFKDITPLLKNPKLFSLLIERFSELLKDTDFKYIVGIESRGFILGSAIANKMNKGFIPARKKGKLPYKTIKEEYKLEYGSEVLEMHIDAIERGDKVVVIDDLLATGGTAKAACNLINKLGGVITFVCFAIELKQLNGRELLNPIKTLSLIVL
ncbi:MAG: adenine phosphoribosyltransferase [Candidatus Micrarchaeaceae archaeon]